MNKELHDIKDVCRFCSLRHLKDINECRKTNCRFFNSWFIKELEKQIINMQGEINTLNKIINLS